MFSPGAGRTLSTSDAGDHASPEFSALRAVAYDPRNLSEAIAIFLRIHPNKNLEEFRSRFGSDTEVAFAAVREIVRETEQISIDWTGKSLIDIWHEVKDVMHDRHPELSEDALVKLGNYFTYLVR